MCLEIRPIQIYFFQVLDSTSWLQALYIKNTYLMVEKIKNQMCFKEHIMKELTNVPFFLLADVNVP